MIILLSKVDEMPQEVSYSKVGDKNLLAMDSAVNFSNWMYQEIKPFLSGNILELGSGIGTYSEKVIGDFKESTVVLSDIDENYIRNLKTRYQSNKKVVVKEIDLNKPEDFKNINVNINSVFALNVLEHIEDDIAALNNIYNVLEAGGKLIILVPAHKILFNCIDKAVGHYRRYSKQDIVNKVKQTKFENMKFYYFNFAAMPGWYVSGSIFKQAKISEGAVGIFDKIVPILKPVEKYILLRKLGMSLIAVLSKPKLKEPYQ
jgi:SAM-dependent methyltransferase